MVLLYLHHRCLYRFVNVKNFSSVHYIPATAPRHRKPYKSYVIALPEIPPTSEINPLLQYKSFPNFEELKPGNIITACAKTSLDYQIKMGDFINSLSDQVHLQNFPSVISSIEEAVMPLLYAYRVSKCMTLSASHKSFDSAYKRIKDRVTVSLLENLLNPVVINAIKKFKCDRDKFGVFEQRIIDVFMNESKQRGYELTEEKRMELLEIMRHLDLHQKDFEFKARICTNMFELPVNFSTVKNLPEWLRRALAEDVSSPNSGPWKVTLHPGIYDNFLAHCEDRESRWKVWYGRVGVASVRFQSQFLGNIKVIEEICDRRKRIADRLGYDSFMELIMENKMAGNVENVLNFIESLRTRCRPAAEAQLNQLQEFADQHGCDYKLAMHDVPYWSRRQNYELYRIDDDEIVQYFNFTQTWNTLLDISCNLFGIDIKDASDEVSRTSDEVKFYHVYDKNGTYRSSFYLDPYSKGHSSHQPTMQILRERSDHLQTKPLAIFYARIPPSILKGYPARVTVTDIQSLFYQFGFVLVHLLTESQHAFLSNFDKFERDARFIPPYVMKMIALHPHTLRAISSHENTQEPLSDDLIHRLIKSKRHMSAFTLCEKVYLSAYDAELHHLQEHWHQLIEKIWDDYIPVAYHKLNSHPCSFNSIFCEGDAGAYYAYLWSEMCAADIYKEFEEIGLENTHEIQEVGKRFRDTFLSMSGSLPASDLFKQFRGRDPSIEYLIDQYVHSGVVT